MEGTALMPRKEKTPQEIFADQFVAQLQPKTVTDVEDGLKSIFGPIFESMLQGEMTAWQGRALKKMYTFAFVDCLYVSIRTEFETKKHAVYCIVTYDLDGRKDILGLWIAETESKQQWLQIFDELKRRGVEDIAFISMDGLAGLEEGARAIFPKAIVQRCIVHLVRNSIKYIPAKEYKAFTANLKLLYKASNKKVALLELEKFKERWAAYPGAVRVWVDNWQHVEQLYNYTEPIRKIMYTTNTIESVNSSFRKVTAKGTFPSEAAVLKVLFLRILELYDKWKDKAYPNWAVIRNQLLLIDDLGERIAYYEQFE